MDETDTSKETEKSAPKEVKEAPPPPKENGNKRKHTILWVTAVLIFIALIWLLYWLLYLQYHQSTDDAYANGNMININSAIPGSVIAFYADDTDLVVEGQLLVQLDPTNYRLMYERELATLASVVLQVRQLYDDVDVKLSNVEIKKIALEKAMYDFQNRLHLVGAQAVSNEEFTHSKDDMLSAEAMMKQAQEELAVAIDAEGNTPLEKHPLIEKQKAAVRTAFYNLEHCSIYAPTNGFVAQRAVEVGQWATTTTPLMAIIPTDYVWVDANFKETQLTYMRIGQPAEVWFDLYGSKVKFHGKVMGIASGTGSVFSVIPPQNATGNWIKIVQRLPVRISLDMETLKKYPARLGISAEVDVDITNQDLPMLAQAPHKRPIGTTKVFNLSLEIVDKVMDEIVHSNLKIESN